MKRKPLEYVPLSDKALLSIEEFQTYTGVDYNKALELATLSQCRFTLGRRNLYNRKKFDKWCEKNCY